MPTSGVSDLVGRVLAGRYRLLAPVGAGASGRVYVADDVRLRRRVAVKVLHAALADDSGFLRRFRAEARLAASLHHPNVMAVYDWGEDELPFMVLELLEGGSLRSMLDRDHRLTPAQAAHLGRQVAGALDYAHTRGLVHRDIKPANLLFDEHGIVRVADFGLARALAEASWTEPAGTVLGTARYASPEQATGAPLDARADLYALALVLVESVTGKVPFVADTTIGTLAARTQAGITAPPELGPLAAVVERAGQRDPDDRYPDAATMRSALADAAAALPPPGPLALAGIHEVGEDPNPTQVGGAAPVPFDQDASEDTAALQAGPAPRSIPARTGRAAVVAPLAIGFLVALALVVAGFAVASASPGGGRVAVPNVTGISRTEAALRASSAGVSLTTTSRRADDPVGTVLEQSPAAGTWISRGGRVHLVVSEGPPPVPVPVVANQPLADAQAALTKAGFVLGATTPQSDETIPKGAVIATNPPAGHAVAPGSKVDLVVSSGPAPRTVPRVSGTYAQAAAAITAQHLTPVQGSDFSDTVPAGQVIGTRPAAGTQVPRDSNVTVVVSKGPQLVVVPQLKGLKVETAAAALQARGLVADVRGFKPGRPVKTQSVPANTPVKVGTTVTLTL
ncbi:MAG TPA: PASTA domain-containing protein [Acidimicrobiia bacterium]|nr:PASTA domain-containing protein [Acidimicrobiia bacterium]